MKAHSTGETALVQEETWQVLDLGFLFHENWSRRSFKGPSNLDSSMVVWYDVSKF